MNAPVQGLEACLIQHKAEEAPPIILEETPLNNSTYSQTSKKESRNGRKK